jgi:hypothetical protein
MYVASDINAKERAGLWQANRTLPPESFENLQTHSFNYNFLHDLLRDLGENIKLFKPIV